MLRLIIISSIFCFALQNLLAQNSTVVVWKVWSSDSLRPLSKIIKTELEHSLRVNATLDIKDTEFIATQEDVKKALDMSSIDSVLETLSSYPTLKNNPNLMLGDLIEYKQNQYLRLFLIDLNNQKNKKSVTIELPLSNPLQELRKKIKAAIFELLDTPIKVYINISLGDKYIDQNYDFSKISINVLGHENLFSLKEIKPNYWYIDLPIKSFRLNDKIAIKISAPGFKDSIFMQQLADKNIILYKLNHSLLLPPKTSAKTGQISYQETGVRVGKFMTFFMSSDQKDPIAVHIDRKEKINNIEKAFVRITQSSNQESVIPSSAGQFFKKGEELQFIYKNHFYEFTLTGFGKLVGRKYRGVGFSLNRWKLWD